MQKGKYKHSRKAQVTCESYPGDLRIYINGILHLYVNKEELLGLQAWYETKNDCRIEITFKSRELLMVYNSVEKWKQVLDLLNEHI